jgi:hypothetical protein
LVKITNRGGEEEGDRDREERRDDAHADRPREMWMMKYVHQVHLQTVRFVCVYRP